ncbi:MAG: hypothetical protein C4532_18000 [Candidatus Abyssobacteria bacterium SURF_17]|uniref:L-2-amino-thiazoline-4-carboxylic acid hydrolase n=1 Tax=Candidatus Abyssobacteria bacterium SURF_17 TaxID=2093361 RepID=A0A419EQG0_9BACT|nr:MAG: hypothetical protein C4532_18000 [Candidatus Abyssubacteria bacterium SURF_17]
MKQGVVRVPARTLLLFEISVFFQRRVLRRRYGKQQADIWLKRARELFKSIYPLIPDIGGRKNLLAVNLELAAFFMPMVVILKEEHLSTREIGEFVFDFAESACNAVPLPFRLMKRSSYFRKSTIEKWRLTAKESSLRKFPADWVFEFVEGGEDYLFGYDIKECGIHKFWRSQGLEEFVPYLCLTDWAKWKSVGIAVERSKTLANGHELCDFRYCRKEKECPSGWPPESNPEWTGKFEKADTFLSA